MDYTISLFISLIKKGVPIIVSEPSPIKYRGLAADYQIFSFFNRYAYSFELHCGKKSSNGFPAI